MKYFLNFLLILLFAAAEATAQGYYVKVNKANVRNKPSMKSTVIGSLAKDARINADEVLDGFIRFNFRGVTGYISLQVVEPEDAYVEESPVESQTQEKDAHTPWIENMKEKAVSFFQKDGKNEKKNKKVSDAKKEKKLKKAKIDYTFSDNRLIIWIKNSYKLKNCLENHYGSLKNQKIYPGTIMSYDPKTGGFSYAPFLEVFDYSTSGNEYVPEGAELLIRTGNDKVYVAKTMCSYNAGIPTYSANYSTLNYQVTGVGKSYNDIRARYFIPESAMSDMSKYGVKKVKLKNADGYVKTFELTDKQFEELAYNIKCWIYTVHEEVEKNKDIFIKFMTPKPKKSFNEGF